ncbi:MAG: hypothetical protein IKD93_04960 [Firmicutes bacterium]|nr:hypothetical protein [Bacillota bacterium]
MSGATGPEQEYRQTAEAAEAYRHFLPYLEKAHHTNEHKIRLGLRLMLLLPLLLLAVQLLTGSSRIAFLLIWIFGMFALAAFLIFTAYADSQLKKALNEMQTYVPEAGEELGELLALPENMEARLSELTAAAERVRRQLARKREKEDGDEDHPDHSQK